jgi:hypothetical protein
MLHLLWVVLKDPSSIKTPQLTHLATVFEKISDIILPQSQSLGKWNYQAECPRALEHDSEAKKQPRLAPRLLFGKRKPRHSGGVQ